MILSLCLSLLFPSAISLRNHIANQFLVSLFSHIRWIQCCRENVYRLYGKNNSRLITDEIIISLIKLNYYESYIVYLILIILLNVLELLSISILFFNMYNISLCTYMFYISFIYYSISIFSFRALFILNCLELL